MVKCVVMEYEVFPIMGRMNTNAAFVQIQLNVQHPRLLLDRGDIDAVQVDK